MKIYTKTGDYGETGLSAGPRVGKEHPRIEAYGSVDELAATLGMVRSEQPPEDIDEVLSRIQRELFVLGGELATPTPERREMETIQPHHIRHLEEDIDRFEVQLPELRNFILPGGSKAGATLHLARTVCRRAERAVVSLGREEAINEFALTYLNRLSDALFVLARLENFNQGVPEPLWDSRA